MLKPFVVRNLKIKSNLILAPMSEITDYPLRKIMLLNGADLVISGMVSSKSIFYRNKKSMEMIRVRDTRPLCIQIFGGDVQSMVYAACECENQGADMIEINAGCPVKKVVKAGAGISLMMEPSRLAEIVYEIRKRVSIPVSVKIRAGINSYDECVSIGKICEENGADVIHLHMRLPSQMHSGPVNLNSVRMLKKTLRIPVIANGGIKNFEDAKKVFAETGADAISIAQGAISNPFIFAEIKEYMESGKVKERTVKEKVLLFIDYLKLSRDTYGERRAIVESRKLIGLWMSGFPHASCLRKEYMSIESFDDAVRILSRFI